MPMADYGPVKTKQKQAIETIAFFFPKIEAVENDDLPTRNTLRVNSFTLTSYTFRNTPNSER